MPSRRCNWCEINWPPTEGYRECPQCREGTVNSAAPQDGTTAEAAEFGRRCDFDWYLLQEWTHALEEL